MQLEWEHPPYWLRGPRRLTLILAALGLALLIAGLVQVVRVVHAASYAAKAAGPISVESSPALPTSLATLTPSPTPTPFRPVQFTPTHPSTLPPTPTPAATNTSPPAPHFAVRLQDDSAGRASLEIAPPNSVNGGKSIRLAFQPGDECFFGSGSACVSQHHDGKVILLTVHSGLGGQSETFRRAVEGTGIDSALFSLARIQDNLLALRGAPVRLVVDGETRDDLELAGVARVPPERYAVYFGLPGDDALALAAEYDEEVRAALEAGEQLLAFEVCGWAVPGEPWGEGVSASSASVYVAVVRDK